MAEFKESLTAAVAAGVGGHEGVTGVDLDLIHVDLGAQEATGMDGRHRVAAVVDMDKGGLRNRNRPGGRGPKGAEGKGRKCRFLPDPRSMVANPLSLTEGAQVSIQGLERRK